MDYKDLHNFYKNFLEAEGYRPTVDNDGDFIFKREGKTFALMVNENDPYFFHLVLPGIWEIESDDERKKAINAANYSTGISKVAKVFVRNNDVHATAEMFIDNPEIIKPVFERVLYAVDNAAKNFAIFMKDKVEESKGD